MIDNGVKQSRLISSHNVVPMNRNLLPRHLDRAIKIAKGEFTPSAAAKQDAAEVAADDIKAAVTPVEEKAAPVEEAKATPVEEKKTAKTAKPSFQE